MFTLISHALGLHRFYPTCSNKYKDKGEGGALEIPPYPMETDSMTMWHQDDVVVSGDEAIVGTLQRRSNQKAVYNMNDAIKSLLLLEGGSSKSRAGGPPKR